MFILVFLVTCSFRGSVPQGLVLEIGETVQILEKCEGKYGPIKYTDSDHFGAVLYSDMISNRFKL